MSGIRQQAISGLKWTTLSQVSRIGTQLLSVLILARLLPPADYGLIAMATTVTGFAGLFRDFGTAAALIQKDDPSPRLLDSVFWLNVAFGVLLALLLGLLAPLIAYGFAEPKLKEVLWGLLLTFPIASLAAVHQALLEKSSCFRPLAIIETVTAFIGFVGAVCAAWAGWGVYSLVLQTLLVVFLTTVCLWFASQWRPAFRWETNEIKSVMNFSRNLVGFNMVNYFIRNADNMLIGRFLGASELGIYAMAYRLMLWPLQNISSVVGRVLFPTFCRLQGDQNRIAGAYVQVTATIMLISAPLMFGFFILRVPFIAVVLGEHWKPMTDILVWLVPLGLLQSIGTSVGSLYLATGRTDVMFKWGVGAGLLVIPAFVIGLQWGITGVAASYAIASLLLFYPGLAIPFRWVGLRVGDVLLKLIPSIATAAMMAGVIQLMANAWDTNMTSQWLPLNSFNINNEVLRLSLLVIVGIITYGGLSLITQRKLLNDIIHAVFNR